MERVAQIINAAAARALNQDFTWGSDDCSTFACDIARDLCGIDLMAPLRGYETEADATARLKAFGGGGLALAAVKLAAAAGLEPAEYPFTANDVLIGVIANRNGPGLAIFYRGAWIGRSRRGAGRYEPHCAVLAWRLPVAEQSWQS